MTTTTPENTDVSIAIPPPRPPDFDAFHLGHRTHLADLVRDLSDPPALYSELGGSPWRKAVVCTTASLVLAAEPDIDAGHAFPAAFLTRLRARMDAADTREERAQLEELMARLSLNVSSLPELCTKLQRRGMGLDALRELHRGLGVFLEAIDGELTGRSQ
jgi:hypothetical protein